jgi:hypothetical protein
MVWADRAVRIDFPNIQLDIANAVQARLENAPPKTLNFVSFPVKPASIVRFQKDHPEIEGAPDRRHRAAASAHSADLHRARRFRHALEQSLDLYRGVIAATIKVVEVDERRRQSRLRRKPRERALSAESSRRRRAGRGRLPHLRRRHQRVSPTRPRKRFLPHEEERF